MDESLKEYKTGDSLLIFISSLIPLCSGLQRDLFEKKLKRLFSTKPPYKRRNCDKRGCEINSFQFLTENNQGIKVQGSCHQTCHSCLRKFITCTFYTTPNFETTRWCTKNFGFSRVESSFGLYPVIL